MRLKRLILREFRNYKRLDISFPSGIIVLTGPNGAGKSNLLEAIHYLSYLKSFRAARDREVLMYGEPTAVIDAAFADDANRPLDARLVLRAGNRHLKFNGNDITKFRDFIGRLHSQFFFPGDLSLLTGDPVLRREVLDLELLRLKPALAPVYQRFNSSLKERNRTLKLLFPVPGQVRSNPGDLKQALDVYTEQLITSGTQIMRERRGITHVLNAYFNPLYSQLSPPQGETVSLAYHSQVDLSPDDKVADNFRERLSSARDQESNLRYTTIGPQRDDLGFIMNNERDLRRFGSQGQIRSAALSFRLALCALSSKRLSDHPILLLDDALSEMDDNRKERLLKLCQQHRQVFITSASTREVSLIEPLAEAVYRVEAGQITVEKQTQGRLS